VKRPALAPITINIPETKNANATAQLIAAIGVLTDRMFQECLMVIDTNANLLHSTNLKVMGCFLIAAVGVLTDRMFQECLMVIDTLPTCFTQQI